MADEPQTPNADDDELLLTDEAEQDEDQASEGEEEEIPTLGDDAEEQDNDNGLVKHLRSVIKDKEKQLADARKSTVPVKIEVGPKPTMWDDGIDGDEDKYDSAMEKWRNDKAAADRQSREQTADAEEQQRQWESRLAPLATEKTALGRPDVDEAFETVRATLGEAKFLAIAGIVDEGKKASLIYALSKHPDRLAALAAQADPILLVKDVTKLEGELKVVKRRRAPDPEQIERGSGRVSSQTPNKQLEKAEKEAERTGDRTNLIKLRKQLASTAKK